MKIKTTKAERIKTTKMIIKRMNKIMKDIKLSSEYEKEIFKHGYLNGWIDSRKLI